MHATQTPSGDDFGRAGSARAQLAPEPHGLSGPSAIAADAAAEREALVTPDPPSVTVRTIVVVLVVMLLVGLALLFALSHFGLLEQQLIIPLPR